MSESDLGTPFPDAMEQARDVAEDAEGRVTLPDGLPFDANEADAADQHREVELDEDDYR